jgi:hypothetical protein
MSEALARLVDGVDGVLAMNMTRAGRDELREFVKAVESQLHPLRYAQLPAFAELRACNAADELLLRGLPDLLAVDLRLTRRDAKDKVAAMERFAPRRAVDRCSRSIRPSRRPSARVRSARNTPP